MTDQERAAAGPSPLDGASVSAVMEREFAAPLHRVWAVATDTDRLNREAGRAPFEILPVTSDRGTMLHARTRLLGMSVLYDGYMPYIRAPYAFAFERQCAGGPVAAYQLLWQFRAVNAAQTRVAVTLRVRPRAILRAASPVLNLVVKRDLQELLDAVDAILAGAPPSISGAISSTAEERVDRALAGLRGQHDARGVDALEALLLSGDDLDAAELRPLALVRQWGVEIRPLVRLLFAAVDAGLLRLRWALLCPSCRLTAVDTEDLAYAVTERQHCGVCAITFGAELDRNVQAVFVPDPAVRVIPPQKWCTGGPATVPHVRIQDGDVTSAAPAQWILPRECGAYRVFGSGGLEARIDVAAGAVAEGHVALGESPGSSRDGVPVCFAPGASVRVSVPDDFRGFLRFEELVWRRDALTARELFLMAEARGRVVPGSLRPGTQLSLGRIAVLFTDLAGSTAFYEESGDAAACAIILDHFEVIRAAVDATGGSMLKTIGDAVLALYNNEEEAALGAVEIDRVVRVLLSERGYLATLGLKMAVHGGNGFLVREGSRLDVFGRTVNRASRLEGQAKAGEVVFSETAFSELPPRIHGHFTVTRRFSFLAKGLSEPLAAVACEVRR